MITPIKSTITDVTKWLIRKGRPFTNPPKIRPRSPIFFSYAICFIIILKNNNLHFEIIINPRAFSAAHDIAGISDVIVESAISTICDNEDSVAAVDSEDKVKCLSLIHI